MSFTETLLLVTNLAIIVTNFGLIIVTGMDNRAIARLTALAIAMISPGKVVKIAHKLHLDEEEYEEKKEERRAQRNS